MRFNRRTHSFFLYIGVLALYSAFSDRAVGAKSAGILCIVGVVNLPIIHFSVEWVEYLTSRGKYRSLKTVYCNANVNSTDFMYFWDFVFIHLVYARALPR